jgi:hypothetical protein
MTKKSASQGKPEDKDAFVIQPKSVALGIVIGAILLFVLMKAGARLSEISLFGLKIAIPPSTSVPASDSSGSPVSLVGITFRTGGWNPRVVDLRTAPDIGIPVWPQEALEFSDLWIFTPEGSNTSEVLIEFYVNDSFIGKIERFPVQAGLKQLSNISVQENFKFQTIPGNYWKVEDSWEKINIVTINYNQAGDKIAITEFPIRLNSQSTSWLIAPPDVSIAGFAYTINDGPETWIDIHDALINGLNVHSGEKIRISQMLYRAELAVPDKSFGIEISIPDTKDSYVNNFGGAVLAEGAQILSNFANPFEWVIDEDSRILSIRFARTDGTLLDYLEIPLKK